MGLTPKDQELISAMYETPLHKNSQKIFKHYKNFYRSIWKLRDAELVVNDGITVINGRELKIWKLTLDGQLIARILRKCKR